MRKLLLALLIASMPMAYATETDGSWDIDCNPREEKCAVKYTKVTWEECSHTISHANSPNQCDVIKATSIWQRYVNARFGPAADIPPGFSSLFSPANGDGRKFVHPDGSELIISGSNNMEGRSGQRSSVKKVLTRSLSYLDQENKKLIYQELKDNWFVIYSQDDKNFYYERCFVDKETITTMSFQYPRSLKDKYAKIVDRISYSFANGKSSMYPNRPYIPRHKQSKPKELGI